MMLKGDPIWLRPIREADLPRLYNAHQDISNRGPYYPWGVMSEATFRQKFQETGLWTKESGTLLIVTPDDEILGHVEFFPTVSYLDELELAYHVYSDAHRGAGVTTEAVRLMTGYLFDTKRYNRIRLIIHPENKASQRVAEKCGFTLEGTARGAWFHRGRHHDVLVYALLREEVGAGVAYPSSQRSGADTIKESDNAATEFGGKTVSRDAVLRALNRFDADYPDTNDYDSWLEKGNYEYALLYGGKRYPCKYILSEASGLPVRSFSGGEETNRVFRTLGFEVVAK